MPSIHLRMSEEQHAELQRSARAAGRSLQAELEWRAFAHYYATRFYDPTRIDAADVTWKPAGLEAGVDESARQSGPRKPVAREGEAEGAGSLSGGDSGGTRPTASQSTSASSPDGSEGGEETAGPVPVAEGASHSPLGAIGPALAAHEEAAPATPSSPAGDASHEVEGARNAEAADAEPTPAPSVPPAPVAARSGRLRRPKNGPCPHRVPEGTYCKQCGA